MINVEDSITKLEYFAARAMQGLISNKEHGSEDYVLTAIQSIKFAKALIQMLEQEDEI